MSLEQNDGSEVVGVPFGGFGQRRSFRNRAVDRVLPGVVLRQHDWQFDHILAFEFLGSDAVQDVRLGPGCGGKLDNRARVDPCLHLARQAGYRVVRLVHDHQWSVNMQQIGEGKLDPATLQLLQTRPSVWDSGEVWFHLLVMGVDLAAFGVRHPQRLNGADHNATVIAQVVRPNVGEVGNIEYAHPTVKVFIQDLPIRVASVLQRFDCLRTDSLCRHQPQDQRIVFLYPGIARHGNGVSAQNRFATAGRQAQADIRHMRQVRERVAIRSAVASEPVRIFGFFGDGFVGVLRPGHAGFFKEAAQNNQRIGLILLQLHLYFQLSFPRLVLTSVPSHHTASA